MKRHVEPKVTRQGVRNLDGAKNGRKECTHVYAHDVMRLQKFLRPDRETSSNSTLRCLNCGALSGER